MSSAKLSTQPLKGMLDFPPKVLDKYNQVKSIIDQVAYQNGYQEYDLPILESWETFAVKSSEEILNEQSYHFFDRGERKILLRPEITPSLARLVAKEIKQLPLPVRWYTVGRCYRYERPQQGRFREFRQLNFDILGKKNYLYDLEIFRVITRLLSMLKVNTEQYAIKYNHRGLVNCWLKQKNFNDDEKKKFFQWVDRRDKLSDKEFSKCIQESFTTPQVDAIYEYLKYTSIRSLFPSSKESLLEDEITLVDDLIGFENGVEKFKHLGYNNIVFSPTVVRGFDYYTGLVFEVFDQSGKVKRSLFGGGRYDRLISHYLKEEISGIGFGMGLDIFILFLENLRLLSTTPSETLGYYIAPLDKPSVIYSLEIGEYLIQQGIRVENAPAMKLSKHFDRINAKSNSLSFSHCVLIGEDELKNQTVTIKNLKNSQQETMPFAKVKSLTHHV